MEYNYEQLDKNYRYFHIDDRKKAAVQNGFQYISEATIKLYRKLKSTKKVGAFLGVSDKTVARELKFFGEPMQGRGGYRPGDVRRGSAPRYWGDKLRKP